MKKRNMWQKALSAILCTSMAAGLCVANVSAEESTYDGEVITLTMMGTTGEDGVSTDDPIGRYIRDKLGIVLEYQVVTDDRLKVMASGGDLPDIVEMHESSISINTLIDSGALWCMDDWLADENNGQNLKTKIPDALKYAKEIIGNGQTYFLPVSVQTENKEAPNQNGFVGFFTRWDYYKELGYPEITSEDDYLNVLKQMVDNHPMTEDGRKVYALSGWTDWGLWPYTISYPFSYGYTNKDNNQLYNQVTDELEDMFVKEDGIFWQTLAFFNKAYRMGIMDPEAFTMKNEQYVDKVVNGEVIAVAYGWTQPDKTVCGEDTACYLLPGAFPYAAEIYPVAKPIGYETNNAMVISSNCKYPERAMELLDYLNSDEGARLVYSGIQGTDWDYVDGVPQLIGTRLDNLVSGNTADPNYDKAEGIGLYSWMSSIYPTNATEDGYPVNLSYSKDSISRNVSAVDQDFCAYYSDGIATYPGEVYVEWEKEGKVSVATPGLAGSLVKPVSEESNRILTKANEYFQANIAKIITCEDEEAFNAQKEQMISDVKAMGYEEALAEVQQNFAEAQETAKIFTE